MARSIVLASNNKGKLAELAHILAPYDVVVHPLSRFTHDAVEETGTTFHANALLKAQFAARIARMPAIADDSGIAVDALQGAPGVYSARYSGLGATDAANNRKLLDALTDVPAERRTASFVCVLAYVESENAEPIFAEGIWRGRVLDEPRGAFGFGYDVLFLPEGSSQTAAEMSAAQKNQQSHRAIALRELAARLFVKS